MAGWHRRRDGHEFEGPPRVVDGQGGLACCNSWCNYYCANQCPIGQQYVPEIKVKDLSQIVLETIASLNAMQRQKERLIEITVDGQISGDELADFVHIQEELEKISIAVETLQLWCERMLDTGAIDQAQYEAYKKSKQ